jgi:hypothetical protein
MNWFQRVWERFWSRYINRQPSPTCQEILRLLLIPENWVCGEHVMVHKASKLGIWTASKDYGISLRMDAKICSDGSTTTGDGQKIELGRRDRRAIYKAIQIEAYRPEIVDRTKDAMIKLYWELKKHK